MSSLPKLSSVQTDDMRGNLAEVYRLLSINPTAKFVIQQTKKDRRSVGRSINALIKRGLVERLSKGVYLVISLAKAVSPCHHFLCLHDLQIEFRINSEDQQLIKNTVLKNVQGYNVHPFGKAGQYFELETIGLITKENLFMFFPKKWELQAKDFRELITMMYDVIEQTAIRWEQRFRINLFKDGRVNFYITNGHIAYENGKIIKELKDRKVQKTIIKDSLDGKVRFVIDMSKKYPHIEVKHPQKQIADIREVEYWGNTLIDGSFKEMHEKSKEFFNTGILEIESKFNEALSLVKKSSEGQIQIGQVLNQLSNNIATITKEIYEIKSKL